MFLFLSHIKDCLIKQGLRRIKLYTRENRRYPHPYATVNDIAGQKEEN